MPKAAKRKAEEDGVPENNDDDALNDYMESIRGMAYVGDREVKEFYEQHKDFFGTIEFKKVKERIGMFLLGLKQEKALQENYKLLSRIMHVEVSAPWTAVQAKRIKNTILEKKRMNGKPTVAVFNRSSCWRHLI